MLKLTSTTQGEKAFHNLLGKLLTGLNILFVLSVIFLSLSIKEARAQIPSPYVPCDNTRSTEFHSTRPYQQSPCNENVTETALYCGNRLIISDKASAVQIIPPQFAPNCRFTSNGKWRCSYTVNKTKEIEIDLSNAELPILGNSELVRNSQNDDVSDEELLTDAERVNDYVSWYLTGTRNKHEEDEIDPKKEEDIDQLVNYSGPINKLLPWDAQTKARIDTIKEAGNTQHDQIVIKRDRITDWEKNISPDLLTKNTTWNKRVPPMQSDFKDDLKYQKSYNEWRGDSCVILPIIRKLLCVDNPLRPNKWADYFTYIPYSSNEDRVGLVYIDSTSVTSHQENVEISNVVVSASAAELFFAHTEEVAGLAALLQSTFVPKGNPETGNATYVDNPTESCYLLNVRSNPGDDLFAGEILGSVSYTANFSCLMDSTDAGEPCEKDVGIGINVKTKTPKADEIWERLVAGPSGIFKRIFPKVGVGGAILGILDIPAATNVTYAGNATFAGNPEGREGTNAELYFPHFGGVHEYFLKGIQTALRPKGYGEPILSGDPSQFTSKSASCNQDVPDQSLPNVLSKEDMYALALRNVEGQEGNQVLECYNDTVSQSKSQGIDPAFALTIWLRESNSSNYNISILDFGYNDPSAIGFQAQIEGFFRTVKSPGYRACACDRSKNWSHPMEGFLTVYFTGYCKKSVEGTDYYSATNGFYGWLTGGKHLPQLPDGGSCN